MIPTPKVAAAGAAGALVTLAVFVAGLFDVELALPDWTLTALTTLIAAGVGWLKGDHDEPGEHAAA
jgi:hypothetical protein